MSQSPIHPSPPRTWERQINQAGAFKRKSSVFRNEISSDNSSLFKAEAGRYHLYVSFACPWAHRTLITRALKGLEDAISVNVVDWFLPKGGWTLSASSEGATHDTVNSFATMREVYAHANPHYEGSITVPVLWDRKHNTIVNNESSEIIRFLNREFQDFAQFPELNIRPAHLEEAIDEINEWIYSDINDGVYKAGFARSQEAYDDAVHKLFSALEEVEHRLGKSRYLLGSELTEADIRLFPTLIRFDAVYHSHFKCSHKRITDLPNIWGYVRDLYSRPAFKSTTNFEHIRNHYFVSHTSINPFGILPTAPVINYDEPHDRGAWPQQ